MRFSKAQVQQQISREVVRQRMRYGVWLPIVISGCSVFIGFCLGVIASLVYGIAN